MATLREYFDTDFNHVVRVHVKLTASNESNIEVALLYDFSGQMAFLACYVPGEEHPLEFYLQLIESLEHGKTQLTLDGKITLPLAPAWRRRSVQAFMPRDY